MSSELPACALTTLVMTNSQVKVGVFDSGIGGLSVVNAIEQSFPELTIIFKNDAQHVPYGDREPVEILEFIKPIFQSFIDEGCQVMVVACNTVSTTLITQLREMFDVPFIAIEPMIKPAAQITTSKIIAVCATPTTLNSPRYAELKQTFATDLKVIEPDCSDWSRLIEHNSMNEALIAEQLEPALQAGADVIVLGCTHYHWIEQEVKEIVGSRATVLQPEPAIIRQLKRVLARQS